MKVSTPPNLFLKIAVIQTVRVLLIKGYHKQTNKNWFTNECGHAFVCWLDPFSKNHIFIR